MQENIISSITESGLALLYYTAGNYSERKEMLCNALEQFNENPFPVVRCGYLLVNKKIIRKEPNQEFEIVEAKKYFEDVINLIDKKDQLADKDFQ